MAVPPKMPDRLPDADRLLRRPVSDLLDTLNGDGAEARVIGGAVRNHLLGLPPGDIDIATTLVPDEVSRRTEARGWKAVPTGVDHGTVTVVIDHFPIEVTTLRADVETDGRRAVVAFGGTWESDAERRDFTMNALSVGLDGRLYDPAGGYGDLMAGRVRFIGDPERRIREDYLRILRFFRFHARFAKREADRDGLSAVIRLRHGLMTLSGERLHQEMLRLLIADGGVDTLRIMAESGILGPVLQGVPRLTRVARLVEIEAALGADRDPVTRLGALAVEVAEDADRLRRVLKLSNAETERLRIIGDETRGFARDVSEQTARVLLYRLGPQSYRDVLRIAWAGLGIAQDAPRWRNLDQLSNAWEVPVFPLKGRDLIAAGVPVGPEVSRTLARLEAEWIASDFALTEDQLASRI
ncbi:MAG: CCA tRNA nucleotidyltransferase [Pseudomonadota bacterium]